MIDFTNRFGNKRFKIKYVIILLVVIIFSLTNLINASINNLSLNNKGYSIQLILPDGTLKLVDQAPNFNEAKEKMIKIDSKSTPHVVTTQVEHTKGKYDKIIYQSNGGFAQSFPYRKGTVTTVNAAATLNIYNNKELSGTQISYIPANYQIQLLDVVPVKNSFSALIQISGIEGYVDINKIDLIPLDYYKYGDQPGKQIKLGGFSDVNNKYTEPNTLVPEPDYYVVTKADGFNEIGFRNSKTHTDYFTYDKETIKSKHSVISSFGIAPTWLQPGTYYSNNGVNFYTDINKSNPVMDGKNIGEYYAYYQWLPINSKSSYGETEFKVFLESINRTNSAYFNLTQDFVTNGNIHGMNPLLVFAQANLESGYGTSKYSAPPYNNIFGWNAVDSNPDNADKYPSVSASIKQHMNHNFAMYMNPNDKFRHQGYSYGDKSSGVSVRYASDPYYGIKIASIAYRVEKQNGFRDYNMYNLSKIQDGQILDFTLGASPSSPQFKTLGKQKQFIIDLGPSGEYTKTHRIVSNKEDKSIDLSKEFVYLPTKNLSDVKQYGTKGEIVKTPVVENKYIVSTGVNLRELPSETSERITTIPKNTRIGVNEFQNIDWAKVTSNNQSGYSHRDYIFQLGDLNGSGTKGRSTNSPVHDIGDIMMMVNHLNGRYPLSNDSVELGDINREATQRNAIDIGDIMIIREILYK